MAGDTRVQAVDDVSFQIIRRGEILGLVGESGCGKTTSGRTLIGLLHAHAGPRSGFRRGRRRAPAPTQRPMSRPPAKMQIIFQDPYASLNPRMTVADIIGEPLDVHGWPGGRTGGPGGRALLERVGLKARPVRATAIPTSSRGPAPAHRHRPGPGLESRLIVCDEPVSALDVSIQAQIINLLEDLQASSGSPTSLSPTTSR